MPLFCPASSRSRREGVLARMTEEPKSKSGPLPSGQLGPLTPVTQAELKASLAVTWRDQATRAGGEFERHYGIAAGGGGGRVVIAGGDVQEFARGVDGGGSPDAGAGGSPTRRANGRLAEFARGFGDGVGLPDLKTVADAQGDYAAAEGAAGVFGIERTRFFPGRDGDVGDALENGGGSGEQGGFVLLHFFLPEKFAGFGFDGIDGAGLVSERARRGACRWARRIWRCARERRLGTPTRDNRCRRAGLARSAGAADENLSADDGGLGVGGDIAFKREGPFELQAFDLIDARVRLRWRAGSGRW